MAKWTVQEDRRFLTKAIAIDEHEDKPPKIPWNYVAKIRYVVHGISIRVKSSYEIIEAYEKYTEDHKMKKDRNGESGERNSLG